jgi:hypothetical protein
MVNANVSNAFSFPGAHLCNVLYTADVRGYWLLDWLLE